MVSEMEKRFQLHPRNSTEASQLHPIHIKINRQLLRRLRRGTAAPGYFGFQEGWKLGFWDVCECGSLYIDCVDFEGLGFLHMVVEEKEHGAKLAPRWI